MRHCIGHTEWLWIQQVLQDISDELFLFRFIQLPAHSLGNIYIADNYNHRIRKVTVSTGIISTIAGTGSGSYSGDNGAATSATLYYPYGVGLDTAGNVYIADTFNTRIRKVTISTCLLYTSDAADE